MSDPFRTNGCPFCSSDNLELRRDINPASGTTVYFVYCLHCKARGPARAYEHMAVSEWAVRPTSLCVATISGYEYKTKIT